MRTDTLLEDLAPTHAFAPRLLVNFASNSMLGEAYRVVRTALLQTEGAESGGTVLVTSAGRGEGKSLTCANLAIVLSQLGRRVVVLDADLRRPTIHKLFGVERGRYATFVEVQDAAGTPAAITPEQASSFAVPVLDDLWVVAAGEPVRQPTELLAGHGFRALLDALGERFDFVLIDSPPLNLITDAAVLAPAVDGVLFVLDFERTRRADARRAVRSLGAVGANVVGTVVNRCSATRGRVDDIVYGGPLR